jgi:hypothetical protein
VVGRDETIKWIDAWCHSCYTETNRRNGSDFLKRIDMTSTNKIDTHHLIDLTQIPAEDIDRIGDLLEDPFANLAA